MLTVLDLFSGIGGFSLGLERTGGFKTVAFCEIDPFCRKVLATHWPGVPIYDDITTAKFGPGFAHVICGGFPCQDISVAGDGAGLAGERSGLWRYMVDAVRVVRPRYVIVENVAAILDGHLGTVLSDLAAISYDAEWHCIPASAVGACHQRDRWWCVATDADSDRLEGWGPERPYLGTSPLVASQDWISLPTAGGYRSRHGLPYFVERTRALGNAVVPQIPELIGRAILQAEANPLTP